MRITGIKPDEAILTKLNGALFNLDHFKHVFKFATRAADLRQNCVFHGLRQTAAVKLADADCSTEEIKSAPGYYTDQMAAYYAKGANQR
jgi:hypothetical protein